MDLLTVLLIGIAGGIGAALRYLIDRAIPVRSWRLGTLTVNVLGSFLLGAMTAMWIGETGSGEGSATQWLAILGTGFCGGLTTFSSASLDAVELAQEESPRRADAYQSLMLLGCLLAAILGLMIGALMTS